MIGLADHRIIYRIVCTVVIVDTALLKIVAMALLFKTASMEVASTRWIAVVLRDPLLWLALAMMAVYLAALWLIPIRRRTGHEARAA